MSFVFTLSHQFHRGFQRSYLRHRRRIKEGGKSNQHQLGIGKICRQTAQQMSFKKYHPRRMPYVEVQTLDYTVIGARLAEAP